MYLPCISQASEAALKADLAALRDDQASGLPPSPSLPMCMHLTAALRADQASGMPRAMAPPPTDAATDAADGGGAKAKKGWGDKYAEAMEGRPLALPLPAYSLAALRPPPTRRVKEMKERAERAKAGLNKSKEKVSS